MLCVLYICQNLQKCQILSGPMHVFINSSFNFVNPTYFLDINIVQVLEVTAEFDVHVCYLSLYAHVLQTNYILLHHPIMITVIMHPPTEGGTGYVFGLSVHQS